MGHPTFRLNWLRILVNPERLADSKQDLLRGGTDVLPVERHGLMDADSMRAEDDDFNALDLGDLCGDGCKLFARGRFETPNLLASRLVNAKLVRVSEEVLGVQSIPNASA